MERQRIVRKSDEPDIFVEFKDSRVLTQSERSVVANMAEYIDRHAYNVVGTGRSARVMELDMWNELPEDRAGAKSWVIKEEVTAELAQRELGITMEDEFRLQAIAWRIIQLAREQYPDKPFAHIPEPLALFYMGDDVETAKPQWIAMEKVEGDTLFNRVLREFLLEYVMESEREEVMEMDKEDLLDRINNGQELSAIPGLYGRVNALPPERPQLVDENDFRKFENHVNTYIYRRSDRTVLTQEQYIALHNTMTALHRAKFHHRDLHPSNIFVRPDGTVSLIDFGASVHKPQGAIIREGGEREGGIYDIDIGNMFGSKRIRLPVDDQWMKNYCEAARRYWQPSMESSMID